MKLIFFGAAFAFNAALFALPVLNKSRDSYDVGEVVTVAFVEDRPTRHRIISIVGDIFVVLMPGGTTRLVHADKILL